MLILIQHIALIVACIAKRVFLFAVRVVLLTTELAPSQRGPQNVGVDAISPEHRR